MGSRSRALRRLCASRNGRRRDEQPDSNARLHSKRECATIYVCFFLHLSRVDRKDMWHSQRECLEFQFMYPLQLTVVVRTTAWGYAGITQGWLPSMFWFLGSLLSCRNFDLEGASSWLTVS